VIEIKPGEIPRVVTEAEDALLLLSREIFQRAGLIMRPVLSDLKAADDRDTQAWQLVRVTKPYLVNELTCAARFLRYDKRSKKLVPTDAPDKVADIYLSRGGHWRLPVLAGVVNTPFLRADGSICEAPGYDAAGQLLSKPEGQNFPSIPQFPSKEDAIAALKQLKEPIEEFPYVTEADQSVALSGFLTYIDRRTIATAPMHAFTSPAAGTGKSLKVDLFSIVATGRPQPVISQGKDEVEFEKRLGAALLAGSQAISIDYCEHPLESAFFGLSQQVEILNNAVIFANGNNRVLVGDLRVPCCAAWMQRSSGRSSAPSTPMRRTWRGIIAASWSWRRSVLRAWHLVPPSGSRDSVVREGTKVV
jgi:hypothetical protein